jgi:predicted nucleic acid-binding protein
MRDLAEIVQTKSHVTACQDEMDNRVIECAIDGRAECIVRGDLYLLGLKSFKDVKIMAVSEFLRYSERA